MTNFAPIATIMQVDSPVKYWYRATTNYGRQITGVRLYGTDAKFAVGQKVAVFEDNNEFGFSELGTHKSQLLLPEKLLPAAAKEAPSTLALAYIAYLANNKKRRYKPATVTAIAEDRMTVTSSVLGTATLPSIIGTDGFYIGARVLVEIQRQPRIIGWWNCLPDEDEDDKPEWWTDEDEEYWDDAWWSDPDSGVVLSRKKRYAIAIGRIPFSANIDISIVSEDFDIVKRNIFVHRESASNSAFVSVYPTTEEDDYFYAKVMMGINFGMTLERYWLKIDKKTFVFFEMAESEFPAHPGVGYSTTADGWFWYDAGYSENNCYIQNTTAIPDPSRQVAFYTGPTNDQWFPLQNYRYIRGA